VFTKIGRPFVFGPIELSGLDKDETFDAAKTTKQIIDTLEKKDGVFGEENIFVHGYKTEIKQRTLKRRTTVLKHSRFLANLVVSPNGPKIFEKKEEKDAEDAEE
jgi:hypothetical protein